MPLPDVTVGRPAVARYPDGAVLARRTIPDHELVWVLQGAADVTADRRLRVESGAVLLLPPGLPHEITWQGPRGCVHGYVHFAVAGSPLSGRAVTVLGTDQDPVPGLCRYLLWLGDEQPEQWPDWAAAATAQLCALALHGPLPAAHEAAAGARAAEPTAVSVALDELARRWAWTPLAPVQVGDLAADAGVTVRHLNRLLAATYGRTTTALLEQLRLARAEAMLTGTSATLDGVARACGFADGFHLSRRFRHAHGMPPGRWRSATARPSVLDDPDVRRAARRVWSW